MDKDKLDDKVDEWHESDTDKSLQEYLGLSSEDFIKFVRGE